MPDKITYRNYLRKSAFWYLGNISFGGLPLLFMLVVYVISNHKHGLDDMQKQIHAGAIMFICTAMMGAVLVDTFQCPHCFRGIEVFATFLTPFVLVGMI